MSDKVCTKCETTKPASEFYADKRNPDGLRSHCKACVLASQKVYRDNNREKVRESHRRCVANTDKATLRERQNRWARNNRARLNGKIQAWREANPLGAKAHQKVSRMLRSGQIARPDACSKCGDDSVKIEASHDDYNQPEVIEWLCPRCHRIKDKNPIMREALK